MHNRNLLPLNLQFFAEPAPAPTPAPANEPTPSNQPTPVVDYDRIQQMLNGTLAAKEDTALKAYFKQQGLEQSEIEQAIATFKQQKAANQPDITVLQGQVTAAQQAQQAAQAAALQAQVQMAATMSAVNLGIDSKTIPYVLRLADLTQVVGQDRKINEDTLKAVLQKVLDDVPALKGAQPGATGFVQIGANGVNTPPGTTTDEKLDRIFGVKK